MKAPWGQVAVVQGLVVSLATAAIIGGAGVIYSQIKPEPQLDQAKAVDYALLKAEVKAQGIRMDKQDSLIATLVQDMGTVKAQSQRIEVVVQRIDRRSRP